MSILSELKSRLRAALETLVTDGVEELVAMVRPAQDARFGDYQANCAMPLGKRLGKSPREVAEEIVSRMEVDDLCESPEIAGPGFINLRVKRELLITRTEAACSDARVGVAKVPVPGTYVVDFSSPNVAKPMHVGHIRSTVIGDAIYRTLLFLGHRALADNHLGDWGTQFGMIIYGYKHFRDQDAYEREPVSELSRLYKLVNQLVEYHTGKHKLPVLEAKLSERQAAVTTQQSQIEGAEKKDKKAAKTLRKLQAQRLEAESDLAELRNKQTALEQDERLSQLAAEHPTIATAVLEETAKLHSGDVENQRLWEAFLPKCRDEIQRVYKRLDVEFDHEHGESFYHDRLAPVVDDFKKRGLARESEGAICVFLDEFDTPMIIQKKDGAFLYATSDLATIQYRMEQWKPNAILYVVDHRQSEHFEKLFAATRKWGFDGVDLRHISFGTVLDAQGKPYKTRSGDTVGLEGLLDEAVSRALAVVSESDDAKPKGPELSKTERQEIAEVVGHGAIKYADLAHHRTSDYVFSYDKMLALSGNTATYMQYSYARVCGIFTKGGVALDSLAGSSIQLNDDSERALALELLRFSDALDEMVDDFRPNQLTNYLFGLTKTFFTFYENCQVLVEEPALRESRLALCDLTRRVIRQGLALLGIQVVDRM